MANQQLGMTARVVDYYKYRPGQNLDFTEVAADLGLTAKQVQNVVSRSTIPIVTTGMPRIYRWAGTSNGVAAPPTNGASHRDEDRISFSLVGLTRAGKLVLEDGDGHLVLGEPVA